jgi:hypothetical protein
MEIHHLMPERRSLPPGSRAGGRYWAALAAAAAALGLSARAAGAPPATPDAQSRWRIATLARRSAGLVAVADGSSWAAQWAAAAALGRCAGAAGAPATAPDAQHIWSIAI